ncbi:thimet oligopeptidase [Vigna angularis]|uniref:Thimet oligopeptidase n=1 Tax=Phaseolus angularis TaxID=3914 RepID=A0A8T0L4I8_PHAAN|nr:thimet oligopeptidase [Vigna angularis]
MTESEGKRAKIVKEKKGGSLLVFTGGAAVLAIAANLAITALKHRKEKNAKKKDLAGSKVRVNLSAPEILKLSEQIIANSKKVHNSVASVPLDKVTYANVIEPLAELQAQQFPLVQSCVFQKMVSTREDVRKASAEAERRIDDHFDACSNALPIERYKMDLAMMKSCLLSVWISKREDVYLVIKAFAVRGEKMNAEGRRFVQTLVRDFERNGLNLTASKREELQRIRAEIDELSIKYIQNLNDDTKIFLFSESELVGLPLEFLKELDKSENGKFKISLRSHHVAAVLQFCKHMKVGTTRKMVAGAYGKRCGDTNISVLESLVQQRHKYARLLGFSCYAEYAIDVRMAKTPKKVFEFLKDISASLTDLATKELNMLKDLKKKEEGELPFGIEDLLYYVKRIEEQSYDLDFGEIKQYFPISVVLSGIFKIVQDLFGNYISYINVHKVWFPSNDLPTQWAQFHWGKTGFFFFFSFLIHVKDRFYLCFGACVERISNLPLMHGWPKLMVVLDYCVFSCRFNKFATVHRLPEFLDLKNDFSFAVYCVCKRETIITSSSHVVYGEQRKCSNLLEENHQSKLTLRTKSIMFHVRQSIFFFNSRIFYLKLNSFIYLCKFISIITTNKHVVLLYIFKVDKIWVSCKTGFVECLISILFSFKVLCYEKCINKVLSVNFFFDDLIVDIVFDYMFLMFRIIIINLLGKKDIIVIFISTNGQNPTTPKIVFSASKSNFVASIITMGRITKLGFLLLPR